MAFEFKTLSSSPKLQHKKFPMSGSLFRYITTSYTYCNIHSREVFIVGEELIILFNSRVYKWGLETLTHVRSNANTITLHTGYHYVVEGVIF